MRKLLIMLGETDGGCTSTEISSIIRDFQSKLEAAQAELTSERDKVVVLLKLLLDHDAIFRLRAYASACRPRRKYKNLQQKTGNFNIGSLI